MAVIRKAANLYLDVALRAWAESQAQARNLTLSRYIEQLIIEKRIQKQQALPKQEEKG